MADPVLDAWIIKAVRITMGIADIRNIILKHFAKKWKMKIEYGPTFSVDGTENLNEYLNHVIDEMKQNKDKIIFFTCNNDFGIKQTSENTGIIETHYQTFIVDTKSRLMIMIDPSRRHSKAGIYCPYAAWYVGTYINHHVECETYWLNLKNPCQVYNDDIFCQTWSLMLLITAMDHGILNDPRLVIDIPAQLEQKYKILFKFYNDVFKIPAVKKQLLIEWSYLLEYQIPREDSDWYKKDRINVLDEFKSFSINDLYTEPTEDEQRSILSNYEDDEHYVNNMIFSTKKEIKNAKLLEEEALLLGRSPEYKLFVPTHSPKTTIKRRRSRSPKVSPQSKQTPSPKRRRSRSPKISPDLLPPSTEMSYSDFDPEVLELLRNLSP